VARMLSPTAKEHPTRGRLWYRCGWKERCPRGSYLSCPCGFASGKSLGARAGTGEPSTLFEVRLLPSQGRVRASLETG
jgi:hypothetical protein